MDIKKSSLRHNLNATVAKMHAVYGKRLKQEDYSALLSCTTVADAADYLKRNTYFDKYLDGIDTQSIHRGNLENILRRSLIEKYFKIIGFEKIGSNEFYNYIIIKTEIDEILICIQHINAKTSDHITTLPIYMNKYTSFNLMDLARVTDFSELLALVEKTPYYDILKPFKPEDETKHIDYAGCELKLRTYYSLRLLAALKHFDDKTEQRMKKYLGTQIDMINIINAYRMTRYFHADKEQIKTRMIPIHTKTSERKLDEIYEARDEKEFMTAFANSYYGREITEEGFDTSNPEMAFVQLRYKQTKRAFCSSLSAPECFFTFNTLSEIEVKNIIRIIEGIRYNLPSKKISELIVY